MTVFLIALGGALGSVARYLSVAAVGRILGPAQLVYGTMIVNVVGSFLMGLAFVALLDRLGDGRAAPLLMTGVLGGFTTFSAFSLDAFRLFDAGRSAEAALYVIGSVVLSLAAVCAGILLARSVLS